MIMRRRIGDPVGEKREGTKPYVLWWEVGGDACAVVQALVDALFCACFLVCFVLLARVK